MRIIITGGTGLIGQALTRSLIADGHDVTVLSRNPSKQKNAPAGAHLVQWDGHTAHGWGELANGADAIVNLAGEGIGDGRWSNARRKRILRSRLNAGTAVMQAIGAATDKPKALVQASAVGYYGPRAAEVVTETESPGSDWLAHVVWACDAPLRARASSSALRVVHSPR